MKKVCVYTGTGKYGEIIDSLQMYIGRFEIERDVFPWMLSYRDYSVYVIDATNMDSQAINSMVKTLPPIIRNYGTRTFVVWTKETWDLFQSRMPGCLQCDNLVFCDTPNWISDLQRTLARCDRRLKNEK